MVSTAPVELVIVMDNEPPIFVIGPWVMFVALQVVSAVGVLDAGSVAVRVGVVVGVHVGVGVREGVDVLVAVGGVPVAVRVGVGVLLGVKVLVGV